MLHSILVQKLVRHRAGITGLMGPTSGGVSVIIWANIPPLDFSVRWRFGNILELGGKAPSLHTAAPRQAGATQQHP